MKLIGVLYGMENQFPPALVDRINSMQLAGIRAEHVKVGGVKMDDLSRYEVIVDRISHDIPFYRSYLKQVSLGGTHVINNPFWWSADDKFFNYALAHRLGVAIPRTVLLPHHSHPPGTTGQSMRNLEYPLDWADIFAYIGFPAFLKPHDGGGWKHVYKVNNPEEFFEKYHETGDLCMTLQAAVDFDFYFRCYVVGQSEVHVMQYDPKAPFHDRYVRSPRPVPQPLMDRVTHDARKICQALGYDFNTVEFAEEGGVPYAIDFMNPAPDADLFSVGPANFEWVLSHVAQLAVNRAQSNERSLNRFHWSQFLNK
jgi:glutathione synthase/RimK-type ligase-like ATP-grasp enzyme